MKPRTTEIYNSIQEAREARESKRPFRDCWTIRPQTDGTFRLIHVMDGRGIPLR